ncbi:hypothetical protein REPUB_Repub07fG0023800 [Reevesia pubescens]
MIFFKTYFQGYPPPLWPLLLPFPRPGTPLVHAFSAISLNSSPLIAFQEVFDKVLSGPVRPHCYCQCWSSMIEKLGSRTPIILSSVNGILGRDALTHEFREVKWSYGNIDDEDSTNTGIVLTVGFVPGLKVDAIPLLRQQKTPQGSMIDKFVMDIKSYTSSVSGCTSPLAIIMIGMLTRNLSLKS